MKCALITGGSRGIGRAICTRMAGEMQYHILINYRSNKKEALNTLKQVKDLGCTGELLAFDVANPAETQAALDLWYSKNPDALIEIIVNNAGINRDGLFMWMPPNDWNEVINTTVNGFYNVTRPIIQKMLRNRYGRIINIVSLAGMKGNPGQTNYSAAKGAIIAATKSLAQEIAKRKVTVNAVAPGFITTDMTSNLDEKELKKFIPAQRFGRAEEVADLVVFLASEKASYITGEIININGGIYS